MNDQKEKMKPKGLKSGVIRRQTFRRPSTDSGSLEKESRAKSRENPPKLNTKVIQRRRITKDSKALVYPAGSVPGYGHIFSLGIAGIHVTALNPEECDHFKSRYVKEKYIVPNPLRDHEGFVSWLMDYGKKQKSKPVLFLGDDVFVYIASLYQKELSPYYLYPYIDQGRLEMFFSKKGMFHEAAKTDMKLPRTLFPPFTDRQFSNWQHFPAVIKPLVSRFTFKGRQLVDAIKFPRLFGGKAVRVANTAELQDLALRLEQENIEFCVQEYIPGRDGNLVVIKFVGDTQGDIPSYFMHRKIRQEPADFGTLSVGRSVDIGCLVEYTKQFCKVTKYVGPGDLEFKWNPQDQQWYFTEINPRLDFSLRMATLNGVNLSLQQYLLSTGQELFRKKQRHKGRYWIDIERDIAGLRWRQKRKEWQLSFWQILKPYLFFEEAVFNWNDPVPGLNRMREILAEVWDVIQKIVIKKNIRRALNLLKKILILCWFKLNGGPPRILKFSSNRNKDILRAFGAAISENGVTIHAPITLHAAEKGYTNLTIHDGCILNGNNFLDLSSRITLGKGVSLGPAVIIMTHNRYNYNPFLESRLAHTCGRKDVLIKEGAGIKARALITMGVTIGRNAVVAGGAVVNRDVADNCFVAGVPARLVEDLSLANFP